MSYHRQNGNALSNGGISSKIDNFFEKPELPMYKDKPYSYAASRKNAPYYRRRRVVAGTLLTILFLLYWLGGSSTSSEQPSGKTKTKNTSWSWSGSAPPSVDWEFRKEAVKEAFILSWDGYEQYAWGTFIRGSPAVIGSLCRLVANA